MSEIRFEYKGQKYSIKGSNFYTANGDLIRDKQTIRSLISAKNQWSSKPVGADNDTVDAKTVIDEQSFSEIETTTGSQSEINKLIDQDLKDKTDAITEAQQDIALLKNQGGDRGYVLCAYSSDAVIQSIAGSPAIINGGSGYKESDVVFVNIESDTIFVKAWAIVGSVDSNGGITSFQLNDKGQISSVGAYQGIEATENLNTFTTGEGTGAIVSITIESVSGSSSNIASIEDPRPGNTVIVLQDETAHNAMYKYIYADKNGGGIFNWIPLTKIEQMPLVGDGDIIQIENGVITTNSTNLSNFCSVNGNITYKPLKNIPGLEDIEVISLDNDHLNYAIETITYGSIELHSEDSQLRLFVSGADVKQGNTKSQSTWVYVPVLNNDGTHKQLGGNDVYFIQNKETQKYIKLSNNDAFYADPFQFAPLVLVDQVDESDDECQFVIYDESDENNPGKHKLVSIIGYNGDDLYTELHGGTLFVIGNSILTGRNTDEAVAVHFQADQFDNKNLSVTLSHENCKIITKRYIVDNKVIDADNLTEGTITIDGSRFYSDHTKVLLYVMPAEAQYNPNIAVRCIDKDGNPVVHEDYACDKGYKFYYVSYDDKTYEVAPFGDVKNDSDIFENNIVTEEFNMKFDDVLKIYIDKVKQVELGQYGLEVADHTGNLLLHTSKSDTKIYDGEGHIMMSHEGPKPGDVFQLNTGQMEAYGEGSRITLNNNCVIPAYRVVEYTQEEYDSLPTDMLQDFFVSHPLTRISPIDDDPNATTIKRVQRDNYSDSYKIACNNIATEDFNKNIDDRKYVFINSMIPTPVGQSSNQSWGGHFRKSDFVGASKKYKMFHLLDLFGAPGSFVKMKSVMYQQEITEEGVYASLFLFGMPVLHTQRFLNGLQNTVFFNQYGGYMMSDSVYGYNGSTKTVRHTGGGFSPFISSGSDYGNLKLYQCVQSKPNNKQIFFKHPYGGDRVTVSGNDNITNASYNYKANVTDGTTHELEKYGCNYEILYFNDDVTTINGQFADILTNYSTDYHLAVHLPDSVTTIQSNPFGTKTEMVFGNNISILASGAFNSYTLKAVQLSKKCQHIPESCFYSGVEIFFNGTLEEFDNIEKHSNWVSGTVYVNASNGRSAFTN